MQNNVFIVGNGFDLALRLPTSYYDFAHAENFWPKTETDVDVRKQWEYKRYKSLESYLEEKKDLENWFDLEQELYNYARKKDKNGGPTINVTNEHPSDVIKNMEYFKLLQARLFEYIRSVQNNFGDFHYDVAREVLKAIINNGFFNSIYSFNYTELPPIPGHDNIECIHLHGSIKEHSIILGVNERPLRDGYEEIMKISSDIYQSHGLRNALANANEVVIFGVSFGEIDFDYFDSFFKRIINSDTINEDDKQHITIFTKNNKSRLGILKQLERMGISIQRLHEQSKFEFICTEGSDLQDKMTIFKERLEKNSQKNNPQYAIR